MSRRDWTFTWSCHEPRGIFHWQSLAHLPLRAHAFIFSSAGPINALSSWTCLVDTPTRLARLTPLPYAEFSATSIDKTLRSLSEHRRTTQSTLTVIGHVCLRDQG